MSASLFDGRLPQRFWNKVVPEPNSGCWLWLGRTCPRGYGRLTYRNRETLAHRVAYVSLVGPVPSGLELDHVCRNPTCCNPAHVEPVTHLENVRRGESGRHNAIKTHCAKGHPYDKGNTRIRVRRGRECRVCIACHVEACRDYRTRGGGR